MRINLQFLVILALFALVACSTPQINQDIAALPPPAKLSVITEDSAQNSGQNPPLSLIKDRKTLNLVKIMDGGACKNESQGAKGAFLIYANPADIERIKHEKGPKIFSDFENKIQTFSTTALQSAIDASNLAEDPFALGADEAQEKLTKQLYNHFRNSVEEAIKLFEKKTTMTIEVIPFAPSFVFYQKGCAATHLEPEN